MAGLEYESFDLQIIQCENGYVIKGRGLCYVFNTISDVNRFVKTYFQDKNE